MIPQAWDSAAVVEALAAYLRCSLWAGFDPEDPSLCPRSLEESGYTMQSFHPSAQVSALADLAAFIRDNVDALTAGGWTPTEVGNDFYLSRNGHGAGFFDRGRGEPGTRLQDAARVYGSVLEIMQDGEIRFTDG